MHTYHENDCTGASEHIFSTDRTVAFQISLDASVLVFHDDRHANVTLVAMEKVLP